MKPKYYSATIRRDLNKQSQGLNVGISGGNIVRGPTASHQNYDYRYLTIIAGTLNDAMQIARANCKTDEEVTAIDLQSDDVIVDSGLDLGAD